MSTEAQLKAISNSELASGNQIPALKHRTVNNAIIEEMYDAQSRGDVLAGVQSAVSIASGDQVLVIRSGQAYLLDSSEFGFVDALADLTDVSIPTPANDQVLAYNTATSKWVAKDVNTLTSVVSISGTATTNALTKFTGTSSIGNSILSDDGTTVTIAGDLSVNNNLTVGTINSGTSSDFVKGDGSLDSTDYQGQIDAEEAARIAADGVLQTNIDNEESARIAADNTLQGNIDAEATTRANADSNLQNNIDAEESARIAADSNLQSQVTTNASNISTNASNISANATDIATNTSDIATNTADITTNQNNIAANTSNIATNTSNIATNTSDIATNTSNIATNTSNIATNTSDIATNTSNIATNTSDIADLQNDKQDISEKNQANGYAPLDSGAKIPLANLPDSVLGQVTYEGTWNASTNTPTLANPPASTTKGDYYVVNTGGTQFSIEFQVGDWIISNGAAWEKVDNTDAVTSVFGRLGNVVANAADYASFYPPNSRTINAGTGLTGGGDLSADRTISHDDTSSQSSVDNTGLTFIQDVTLDGFGHVTALGSATVTLPTVNDDTITLSAGTGLSGGGAFTLNQSSPETITFNNTDRGSSQNIFKNVAVGGQSTIVADSNNDTLTLAAGTNVSITTNSSTDTITINSTDQFTGTITSVATGSGLTGGTITTSGTISHADTSSQGSVNNSGGTVIQDVTLDGFGHVTGLASIDLDGRYVQSLTDTLDSVTDRGATTTNSITVGGATINGNLTIDGLLLTDSDDRSGLLEVHRKGASSWTGYSIDFDGQHWSFMGNAANVGLYDDTNNEWIFRYDENAGLSLRYNGLERLLTTSAGISVTGTISATAFSGDGSALTSVNAATLGGEALTEFMLFANPSDVNWTNGKVASYQNGEFVPVALPSASFTSFNLAATVGGSTTITDGETITFIDGLNTTATRVGNTIQIDTALASNVAYTDVNNNFSVGQTIGGNTTINGNLTVAQTTGEVFRADASSGSARIVADQNNVTFQAPSGINILNDTDISGNLAVDTDTLFVDATNNRVGIGADSPASKLDIVQTASTRGFQVFRNEAQDNTEALAYFTDENTTNKQATVRIRQDGTGDALQVLDGANMALVVKGDTGNVGIGESSPNSTLTVSANAPRVMINTGNAAQSMGVLFGLNQSATAGILSDATDENLIFRTGGSLNSDERMRIDSSGNVGIGTDIALAKTHIKSGVSGFSGSLNVNYDDLAIEGGGNTGITILTPNANNGGIAFSDEDANVRGLIVYSHSNDDMAFRTANSEAMRIDSSGNVGIGTSSPSFTAGNKGVHIVDATSPAIRLQDSNAANSDFTIYSPNGVNELRIYHENTAKDLFKISSSTATFDVNATINGTLTVDRTGASNYLVVSGDNNASYDIATQYTDGTNSVFAGMMRATSGLTGAWNVFTGGAVRMSVDSSGNVGIGKSPAGGVKLDVNGKIVSGDVDCARINTDDPGLGAGLWKLGKARVASTVTGNTVVRVEIDGVDYDLITTTVTPT